MASFKMSVWSNIVAAALTIAILWAWQKYRGGRCPLCNQRTP